jgi:hypothetical protein
MVFPVHKSSGFNPNLDFADWVVKKQTCRGTGFNLIYFWRSGIGVGENPPFRFFYFPENKGAHVHIFTLSGSKGKCVKTIPAFQTSLKEQIPAIPLNIFQSEELRFRHSFPVFSRQSRLKSHDNFETIHT